jgi:hypothetical protein
MLPSPFHVSLSANGPEIGKGKKSAQPPQRGANQFPDVNSATAEVISRAVVVRTYCALHRHVLYCGELGRGQGDGLRVVP